MIFRSSGGIRKLNELKSILAEVWLIKPAAGTGPLRAASTEALPQKKHTAPNVPVRGAKSGLGSARTEQKTECSWREIAFVSDVSTDRAAVEQLARRCTEGQLDPIHLLDVVEDAL